MFIKELEYSERPTTRRWSPEEEEVLKAYYPKPKNVDIDKIAGYLNRTHNSVMRKVANMGITRNGR